MGAEEGSTGAKQISFARLVLSCTIAGGVQYGWALQLSLLTPYVQTLGLSHTLSSLMWLCGPVAGFVVQPLVGVWSDKCRSPFGRRRPFILVGCLIISASVLVIGFSSDIGYALGDTKESCRTYTGPRWKAAMVYVVGFWILDFANNAVQGPARALMADLSGEHGCNAANAIFASWMAFGNILGYSSGSSGAWNKWFPFLMTEACCEACANLKGAFFVAVIFLFFCLMVTLIFAQEVPFTGSDNPDEKKTGFMDVFKSFNNLPPGMASVLFVTAVTWVAWFPYILYNTDWMGREIFHGDPSGTRAQMDAYDRGVRAGAFGLLLNSILLAISSLQIDALCRRLTAKLVWVIGNFTLFLCLVAITVLSMISTKNYTGPVAGAVIGPDHDIKIAALAIFTVLGFPLAILFSIPFAFASQLAANEGGGQGLCIGVLNISIVVPQVIVALGAGPWDGIFGAGNTPAFGLAAAFAFVGGFVALTMLPKLSKSSYKSTGVGGMH